MRTEVSILHHDYPGDLRAQVEGKLLSLARFNDQAFSLTARLERQGHEHRVELVAHISHGGTLVADVCQARFSASLEEALDRMRCLLRKAREKQVDSRRRSDPKIA
jgi:ribosomal subunit interface protein